MGFRTAKYNPAAFIDKDAEMKKLEAQQASAKKQQEGGDIGGILGMLALGLGAAAVIGTGGLAAPFAMGALAAPGALGAITGAATLGSGLGKAVGTAVSTPAPVAEPEKVNEGQKELDMMGAMQRKINGSIPPISGQTELMTKSLAALGNLPKDIQKEYGNVLMRGIAKSYGNDILNSRRKV